MFTSDTSMECGRSESASQAYIFLMVRLLSSDQTVGFLLFFKGISGKINVEVSVSNECISIYKEL